MLRGCYTLIQVFEMLLGIWIIYNLYPEFRKEGRLIQGLWIIVHRIIINWLYLHLILCQPIQLPPDLFHRACMSNGKLPALC